jgi:hypothetical protein
MHFTSMRIFGDEVTSKQNLYYQNSLCYYFVCLFVCCGMCIRKNSERGEGGYRGLLNWTLFQRHRRMKEPNTALSHDAGNVVLANVNCSLYIQQNHNTTPLFLNYFP